MPVAARVRRQLVGLSWSLLAGMLTSIATAWGCALLLDPDRVVAIPMRHRPAGEFSAEQLNALRARLLHQASDDEIVVCEETAAGVRRRVAFVDPYWHSTTGFVYEVEFPWSQAPVLLMRVEAGWPMQAMVGTIRIVEESPAGGFEHESDWACRLRLPGDVAPRTLPLRPILPGFAFNAMAFGGVFLLAVVGPRVVLRTRRRRRGLCERCGYPRGESHRCSECGAESPPR